jgi:CheY-like chemotaxis protein
MGRALIAEDAEPVRRLLKILLEREGLQVDTATTGSEALAHLRSHHFDLILLDLMMPQISGYEVLSHLSQHRPEELARLIIITAAPERELSQVLASNPALVVIRKPFDIRQVAQAVRERLGGESASERAVHPPAGEEQDPAQAGQEPGLFALHCVACKSTSGFEARTERESWDTARLSGWQVVAFPREDIGARPQRHLITICPACTRLEG